MPTTKKTYTKEFKEEAVRLAKQTGKRSRVARDLGIQASMLRRWQLELEQHQQNAFPGKGKPVDEELTRLQRENQRLKQEVEILEPMLHSLQVQKGNGYLGPADQIVHLRSAFRPH